MRKILTGVLIFCASALYAQPKNAQFAGTGAVPDGVIKGVVITGKDMQPLEFASVGVFRMQDSTLVTGTLTDNKGNFSIEKLPYGKYYVEVNYVGFRKFRVNNVVVSPKNHIANTGNIEITENSTALNEVVVVGQQSQVEYKLDRKVVNVGSDIVAAGGSAVDALQNVPSVQTDVDGNVTLRGSSSFTVLIDGKPSVLQGSEALQQIPAGSIENIEIITNPSAKYDPDGVSGIINVVMKKQKFAGISGQVNATTAFNQPQFGSDFLLNYRTNKVNFFVGADWNKMQFPGNMKYLTETYNTVTDTNLFMYNTADNIMERKGYGFKGGMEWNFNSNNSISLSGNVGNRAFLRNSTANYHEYTMPESFNSYYIKTNNSDGAWKYFSLNSDYTHNFAEKGHQLSGTVYFSHSENHNVGDYWQRSTDSVWQDLNPSAGNAIRRSLTLGLQNNLRLKLDYVKPFTDKTKLEAGYQGRFQWSNDTMTVNNYDPELNTWTEDTSYYNPTKFLDNIQAAYVTFSSFTRIFDFQLGLRAEYNDRNLTRLLDNTNTRINRFDLFPTIHLSKQLPKDQQVQLSYSRRVERPDRHDIDPFIQYMDPQNYMVGNPKLLPEFTDSYELNYQKKFGTSFVSAETYFRQTNNLIERVMIAESTDPNNPVFKHTMENVNKDRSIGLELMGNVDIAKWWNMNVTATGYYYKIIGYVASQDITSSTYTGNLRMNNTFRLKWGTRIQLMGIYNAPSIEPQGTEGYMFFTNLGIRQDFLKHKLISSLQVRDIFNTMRRTGTSKGINFYSTHEFRRSGRIVSLTLTYKFNNFKQNKNTEDDINQRDMEGGDGFQ